MARIRTIKPEFPQSETVGKLTRDARLLFVQLWTIADDAGRLRGASRMLASLLYPYDDDAPKLMPKWLSELEQKECIRCYEVEGSQYIEITNWLKHQKIDKPSKSHIPPFDEASRTFAKPLEPSATDLGPRTSTKDQDQSLSDGRVATRPDDFENFWKSYPRREGANPKTPARKIFVAAVKAGTDPAEIIAGANRCAASDRDKIGTPYIPQAVKWLRDRRWEDYANGPPNSAENLSDDAKKRMFEELRNGSKSAGKSEARGDVLPTRAGPHADSRDRGQRPAIGTDDSPAGHSEGMVSLGAVLLAPSGFRALRDETSSAGDGEGNDRSRSVA